MSSYTLVQLQRIAEIIQCPTSIVLTSSNWGRLALEIGRSDLVDPTKKPTPGNFKSLDIHGRFGLRVVNSGTEDEKKCDEVNYIFERQSLFVEARDRFAVPVGSKKDPIEFVDAESTHEVPDDLRREIRDRSEKGAIPRKQVVVTP